MTLPVRDSKVTALLWGEVDELLIAGFENGEISQWDLRVSIFVPFFYLVVSFAGILKFVKLVKIKSWVS